MKKILVFLYSMLVWASVSLTGKPVEKRAAESWAEKDYAAHDCQSFAKLPQAKKRMERHKVDFSLLRAAVFYESNRRRKAQGLPLFAHSPALEKAAQGHSADMVQHDFFAHESPVKGKESMGKRLVLAGASGGAAAENLALSFGVEYTAGRPVYPPRRHGGYFSYSPRGRPILSHTYLGFAKAVVQQWMDSPGHRANLLNPAYRFLGVGAAHFQDKKFFGMDKYKVTQNFSSIKESASK